MLFRSHPRLTPRAFEPSSRCSPAPPVLRSRGRFICRTIAARVRGTRCPKAPRGSDGDDACHHHPGWNAPTPFSHPFWWRASVSIMSLLGGSSSTSFCTPLPRSHRLRSAANEQAASDSRGHKPIGTALASPVSRSTIGSRHRGGGCRASAGRPAKHLRAATQIGRAHV